jgi:hypothetical protein
VWGEAAGGRLPQHIHSNWARVPFVVAATILCITSIKHSVCISNISTIFKTRHRLSTRWG